MLMRDILSRPRSLGRLHESPADAALEIARNAWEGRDADTVRATHAPDARVVTPTSVTEGVEDLEGCTTRTNAMFPERRNHVEEAAAVARERRVVSAGRIVSTMRHTSDSHYGPAGARRITVRTLTDTVLRDNAIEDEWMVRDRAAIVRQLGGDVEAVGRTHGLDWRGSNMAHPPATYARRWRGGPSWYEPEGIAAELVALMRATWSGENGRPVPLIARAFDHAVEAHMPGGVTLHGAHDVAAWFVDWAGSFTDARFRLENWVEARGPSVPARIALRWSVRATHGGCGHFGEPTGQPVALLGLTQLELRRGRVHRLDMGLDELAIWAQVSGFRSPYAL